MHRLSRWFLIAAALLSAGLLVALTLPEGPRPRRDVDFAEHAAGPVDELSVYWVGHSLMNARDPYVTDARNLLELVGDFARERDLGYESFDHTLYGAPLSLLWSGSALSYQRAEPEMLERRRELLEHGDRYDALVLTEGVPVSMSLEREYPAYYAQQFYCTLLEANPDARVYVYETWVHFQASDRTLDYPPVDEYVFTGELASEREHWEQLADSAASGLAREPGMGPRLARRLRLGGDRQCSPQAPIFLIPVATAMRELAETLDEHPGWTFRGEELEMGTFFANPFVDTPEDWPRDEPDAQPSDSAEILAGLTPRYPDDEVDDVHPSDFGVYFTGLVHFATLYRRSPVGLPTLEGLPEEAATAIQELVWRVVRSEPRTGVAS